MKSSEILSLFSSCLLLVACSSVYRQAGLERVPRSESAVIELYSCADDCPIIQEIDGTWRGIGSFKEFEIKPGERNVKFIFVKAGFSGERGLIVSFDAKQGAVYSVRANADYSLKEWHPVVLDRATGQIVSKLVGSGFAY